MNIFKRIMFALTYGPELEYLAQKRREQVEEEKREAKRYHLNLCHRHQQEQNRSHYAPHNCDYCKMIDLYEERVNNPDILDVSDIKLPINELKGRFYYDHKREDQRKRYRPSGDGS